MVEAVCLNDTCSKESWTLRKHPSEYSSGLSCPECGTTRVETAGDESPRGQGGETAPARPEGSGGGQAPATQQGGLDGASTLIALADSDAPTQQRAEAAQNALGFIGEAVGTALNYQEQKKQARAERVKQASVEPADDLPTCVGEECGFTFTGDDIPLGRSEIRCPDCGEVNRVVMPE